ncbi:zinc-ribbon domain-containing protein [Hymenobacter saemangeumensis]|uniref:Zinc-ribbon domain-containing protein n=1 Tax=Hymenobacter saemangeumensis TaxID=1084522 RepID=A0ABP8ILA5_9BACT
MARFIARAEAVHGIGTYDYSQAVYVHSTQKLTIICPLHGPFEQTPNGHAGTRRGCPKCGIERAAQKLRFTTAHFITRARAIHGSGTYDYSQAVYTGSVDKVKILCPKHGAFELLAQHHLRGAGCSHCSRSKTAERQRLNTATFIAKAQAVHGVGRYDYTQTIYTDSRIKVTIICPEHGAFEQIPRSHGAGQGCLLCGNEVKTRHSRLGWAVATANQPSILYFLKVYNEIETFYKVGVTRRSIQARYRNLFRKSGYQYEVLASYTSVNAAAIGEWEKSILDTFAHLRYRPKRAFGGRTECFSSAYEILAVFPF